MKYKLPLLVTVLFILTFIFTRFILASSFKTNSSNPITVINQNSKVEWKAPPFADKMKNPLEADLKVTKDGKITYTTNCASCHGDKGEGNGPAAAALNPKPKNLSSEKVQLQSDGAIFWKITTGNPPMVSWKDALTEKQRWGLVNYIRQLRKK
ncbi:MAG: cytochrome c [Ignavibacteriales bacterium]|nr:cytochrome c [Ignavibacteriales bacterium]